MSPDSLEPNFTFTVIADAEDADTRIDVFLAQHSAVLSRAQAQRFIREGAVFVNGKSVKPGYTLDEDDIIQAALSAPDLSAKLPEPEHIPIDVVYEDEFLLIVNKPAGMVTHAGPGHEHGTLVNALLGRGHALAETGVSFRPGIAHRLDKDTSGLLIVAKTDETLLLLGQMMRDHTIVKEYIALVAGYFTPAEGAIDAPIGRDPRFRQRMAIDSQHGRSAITLYKTVQILRGASLLRLTLQTGRTHQIRVHCAAAGHPIIGDLVYGRPYKPEAPRQFLHAAHITFRHPITGAEILAECPLPDDLANYLHNAKKSSMNYRPEYT